MFILRGAARTLFVKQTGRNVARVIFKKGIPIRKLFFALPFFFPSFSFFSFFLFESFRTLVLFSFFFLILKLINERGNLNSKHPTLAFSETENRLKSNKWISIYACIDRIKLIVRTLHIKLDNKLPLNVLYYCP